MIKRPFLIVFCLCLISFNPPEILAKEKPAKNYSQYVNVFIGTGSHGHTYPGVCLPFGMVQLSPDTRLEGWDGCAGYHYSDNAIYGFSHTHLSGVGVPDYGDILFMPVSGKVLLNHGDPSKPGSGYLSRFQHANEKAEPGYYSVILDDYNIKAELTATERVGFHKYSFPENSSQSHVLIDLQHRDPVIESEIKVVNEYEIEGYRRGTNWALDKRWYFVARFSKPIKNHSLAVNDILKNGIKSASGQNIKAVLDFDTRDNESVMVKVAISAVSADGARKNLDAELKNWDFAAVRKMANKKWNSALSKIEVEGGTDTEKRIFYTSLYHCYLTPNLYMDVDGKYRGMDMEVHTAKGFDNYTVFSLWDTYRALHPLFTIIDQKTTAQFINTLIEKSKQYGALPMWELAANDTRCMIGYHAVSVIADAFIKGITNFNKEEAFQAMKTTAGLDKRGLVYYKEQGFVPSNKNSQSVSKTLEYAYNDWCIAQMAKALNHKDDYEYYIRRSQFYRNVFDQSTGFMRGRNSTRQWRVPFDPQAPGYDYTEGNSFQYLYVPHDVPGLIQLMGGDEKFENWMHSLFTTKFKEGEVDESDISGMIGQYAHGNEPSHHFAYLYNFAGTPWRTQKVVRQIMDSLYFNTPDGLCGNEDCGQMSAWYVLSAIGFYPVCPGQDLYEIGSPVFSKVTINLENGKHFVIKADNNSDKNIYIKEAKLNGLPYGRNYISHSDIMNGSVLELEMTGTPNKAWGAETVNRPPSLSGSSYVMVPYLKQDHKNFISSLKVELACETEGAQIYYTLDGTEPTVKSQKFTSPFEISRSVTLKYRAFKDGLEPSYPVETRLIKTESFISGDDKNIQPGIAYKYYDGVFRSIWDFEKEMPESEGIVNEINLDKRGRDEWFAMEFAGLILIPEDGEYTFYVNADDGGQLTINGEELFESDGRKSFPFEQHSSVILKKGFHRIGVKYFQCSGNKTLEVSWESSKIKREPLPSTVLFHKQMK